MFRFLIIGMIFISGCTKLPEDVDKALAVASDNKTEILEAIEHYNKSPKDSSKLKALYFLIGNMGGKGFIDYDLIPSRSLDKHIKSTKTDNKLDIAGLCRAYQFAESDSLYYAAQDSLLINTGFTYSFKRGKSKADIQNVTKEMLIGHIDAAFDIWNTSLWKSRVSYENFCQYVLPYRIDREPLQAWLPTIRKQATKMLADSGLTSCSDPERIIHAIDNHLKKSYGYNRARVHAFPRQLNIEEISLLKGGTCEDLATLSGYWLRAVGIPVTAVKIPIWSHMNAGHTMLAVIWSPSEIKAFNPFEKGNGIKYETFDTPRSTTSKIFLSTFKRNSHEGTDIVLSKLYGQDLIDVTEVVSSKVSDVILDIGSLDDSYSYYLTVANRQEWQPVQKGLVTDQKTVVFPNMVEGILYMPIAIDKNGIEHPFSIPMIKINGKRKEFGKTEGDVKKYTFKTKMGWGIKKPGDRVEILRWEQKSGWNSYAKVEANEDLLLPVEVESGVLYSYKIIGHSGLVDRPFSVNADSIMVY